MANPFSGLTVFIVAVLSHVLTLLAGCVATVMLGILEKHVLKRPLSVKVEIGVLACFAFFACFQAWKDQGQEIRRASDSHETEKWRLNSEIKSLNSEMTQLTQNDAYERRDKRDPSKAESRPTEHYQWLPITSHEAADARTPKIVRYS